jgi:16S rRNA (cytosine967-C5)-methyltransferase
LGSVHLSKVVWINEQIRVWHGAIQTFLDFSLRRGRRREYPLRRILNVILFVRLGNVPASARVAAYEILRKTEAGGYASDLLRAAPLDPRDAGLASQIVFGVLRFRAQLDFLVDHYSGSGPDKARRLDPEVRTALHMGIFQLRYLERIPAHAAVADSVELVKRARKRSAAGLVNAVLRKVDRAPMVWPNREVELSCPEWLLERWARQYSSETAVRIAGAALAEPETFVRSTPAGPRIQDIGAQSIVPLLALERGMSLLDLCAAPGNKTAQALEVGARIVDCDVHFHRLRQMKGFLQLHPGVSLVVTDGTRDLPFRRCFDRILVDAPCSGTGTLGRNPEIKWRLGREDLADLHCRQTALVAHALEVLAPGGRLVYATCSLEREENEEVVAAVLRSDPKRVVRSTMHRIPGVDRGDGFFAAVLESEMPENG